MRKETAAAGVAAATICCAAKIRNGVDDFRLCSLMMLLTQRNFLASFAMVRIMMRDVDLSGRSIYRLSRRGGDERERDDDDDDDDDDDERRRKRD